jgi:hypothetical protein
MNRVIVILIIGFLISCNSISEQKKRPNSTKEKVNPKCYEFTQNNDEFDLLDYSKSEFQIDFNEKLKNKNFRLIDRKFYDKYLNDKEVFQNWGNDLNEHWEIKHKLVGFIESDEICKLLIYEKFYWDVTEEKIFLLLINQNGDLIDKYLIAEYSDYAGGRLRTRSNFSKNEMTVISIDNGINDQDGDRYQYYYDSIISNYEFKNNNYILIKSDTSNTTHWK